MRSAYEAEKPHFMQTVVKKWDGFRFKGTDKQAGPIDVSSEYDGLSASCSARLQQHASRLSSEVGTLRLGRGGASYATVTP